MSVYEISEEDKKWCDKYLQARYVGCVKDKYADGCNLYFKDLNNFVQNAGRHSDLEIFRLEGNDGDYEIMFNTKGTFIDRVWPELPWDARSSNESRALINHIAYRLQEGMFKEGEIIKPLPKIEKFMEINYGEEVVKKHRQFLEDVINEESQEVTIEINEESDVGMKMEM